MGQECTTQQYKVQADGTSRFKFRGYFWMMMFQYMGVEGSLVQCGQDASDTCKITMDKYGGEPSKYTILDTDYDNYFIQYTCDDTWLFGFAKTEWLSINARTETLSPTQLSDLHSKVLALLPSYDLSGWTMTTNSNKNCQYDWSL